jgi:hypothetical protein
VAATVVSAGPLRDQFLNAIDSHNRDAAIRLAAFLTESRNPLPGEVCTRLGLPRGSLYAAAARKILAIDTVAGSGASAVSWES